MNDVVPVQRPSLAEQKDLAVALATSDLLPGHYRGKPQNVLVAMQWADALGVTPMTAMQQLAIIDGKPTASAQMIAGLVRRAGHNLRVQGDDQRAVCEITRYDDPEFVFKSVWTMDRAQKAGLAGKSTWKQYPAAMLKARATTEAARDACPEALMGVAYATEEMEGPPQRPARVSTARVTQVLQPDPDPVPVRQPTEVPGVVVDADGVMWDADPTEAPAQ